MTEEERHPLDEPVPNYVLDDLKRLMARVGANEHWYKQHWMGIPIWQLPDDLMRLQNIIWDLKPTVIFETGTKFGGSAIFFASILKLIDDGTARRVITCDISLPPAVRALLEEHPLNHYIHSVIEGDAAGTEVAGLVAEAFSTVDGPKLVFLDDNHNKAHVLRELELYAHLLAVGDLLIVADTVFEDLADTPLGIPSEKYPDVANSNPRNALREWLGRNPDFESVSTYSSTGISNFADGILRKLR